MGSNGVIVVHLLGSLDRGGAEVRTLELLRRRTGRERHIFVALSGRTGALDREFEKLGHTIVHKPLSPTFALWFVSFLRRSGATHVHSHVHMASGYFLALAVAAGVPRRIAHFRSTSDGRRRTWRRAVYRKAGATLIRLFATDVVMVSHAVADSVWPQRSAKQRARFRIVYDQIDGQPYVLPSAQPHPRSPPRLVTVGRLDRDKNPQRALELLAALRERRPEASLSFVGRCSPSDREAMLRRIESLGLTKAVSFLGQRDDVPELLVQFDLLLATTLREGLPGSIVEAAAAGIPAVVSAIPANEEVAALIPSVLVVPLAASDEVWCDVIEDALDARADRLNPVVVREWFDGSPLSLKNSVKEIDALWS